MGQSPTYHLAFRGPMLLVDRATRTTSLGSSLHDAVFMDAISNINLSLHLRAGERWSDSRCTM